MAEHDPADFIPLARAASLAHDRLFPHGPKDSKRLDLVALALSAHLPLYQRDMDSGGLRRLDEAEIAAGRFTRGATTLEYASRPPLRYLVVSRSGLAAAIEKLTGDASTAASLRPLLSRSCAPVRNSQAA
jgi:hypothetical protein